MKRIALFFVSLALIPFLVSCAVRQVNHGKMRCIAPYSIGDGFTADQVLQVVHVFNAYNWLLKDQYFVQPTEVGLGVEDVVGEVVMEPSSSVDYAAHTQKNDEVWKITIQDDFLKNPKLNLRYFDILMTHEIGHLFDLPDLYSADAEDCVMYYTMVNRDKDVDYNKCNMLRDVLAKHRQMVKEKTRCMMVPNQHRSMPWDNHPAEYISPGQYDSEGDE